MRTSHGKTRVYCPLLIIIYNKENGVRITVKNQIIEMWYFCNIASNWVD